MGSLLAATGATGFGIASAFARFAYGSGATPLTLVMVRTAAFVLLVGGLLLVLREPFRLSRAGLRAVPWLAVAAFFMSIGYLSAVAYIPVSLAVLLLYTNPFMVGLLTAITGRERLSVVKLVALAVAFAGIALALGPKVAVLDPRGIFWALASALAIALPTAFSRRILAENRSMVLNWYVHLALLPLLLLFGPLVGSYGIPADAAGLGGATGSVLGYILGYVCWFLALTRSPAIRVSLVFNLEPPVTFLMAALLLGERLTLQQLIGSALVLAAIVGQTLWRERGRG